MGIMKICNGYVDLSTYRLITPPPYPRPEAWDGRRWWALDSGGGTLFDQKPIINEEVELWVRGELLGTMCPATLTVGAIVPNWRDSLTSIHEATIAWQEWDDINKE